MKTCLLEDNKRGCFTQSNEMNEEDCGDDSGSSGSWGMKRARREQERLEEHY